VMVIMNANNTETTIATKRYEELLKGKTKAKNVLTEEVLQNLGTIKIPPKTALILEVD